MDKAQKYTEKALTQIEKLKCKCFWNCNSISFYSFNNFPSSPGEQTDPGGVPDHPAGAHHHVPAGDGQQVARHQGDRPGQGRVPIVVAQVPAQETFPPAALSPRSVLDVRQPVRSRRTAVLHLHPGDDRAGLEAVCQPELGDRVSADEARAGSARNSRPGPAGKFSLLQQSSPDGKLLLRARLERVSQE